MYLLDTDILSNLMKHSPLPILIAKLATVPVEQQFTSKHHTGRVGIRCKHTHLPWLRSYPDLYLDRPQILKFFVTFRGQMDGLSSAYGRQWDDEQLACLSANAREFFENTRSLWWP